MTEESISVLSQLGFNYTRISNYNRSLEYEKKWEEIPVEAFFLDSISGHLSTNLRYVPFDDPFRRILST